MKRPRVKRPRVKRPRVKRPRVKRPRVKRPRGLYTLLSERTNENSSLGSVIECCVDLLLD